MDPQNNTQEIHYTGLAAVPDDRLCPDGQLALPLNLLNEDGTLRPLLPPRPLHALPQGTKAVYIHSTSLFTHYILLASDGSLSWISPDGDDPVPIECGCTETLASGVTGADAIGNTLLILTHTGVLYFLWKEGSYRFLGDSIPTLQMSFGLIGYPRLFSISDDSRAPFPFTLPEPASQTASNSLSEANRRALTEQVMAKVNSFIASQTVNRGRFCFPFLLRYALRLYDGTLTHQSAPILLNPSTTAAPVVMATTLNLDKNNMITGGICDIMLVAASIDWQVIPDEAFESLSRWSDIVKGVEVYISKPLYTYDQSGEIPGFSASGTADFSSVFIGRLGTKPQRPGDDTFVSTPQEDRVLGPFAEGQTTDFLRIYSGWSYAAIYQLYFSTLPYRGLGGTAVILPPFDKEKVDEAITSTSVFYKILSIEIPELGESLEGRKEIVLDDDFLQSLLTRETLPDDFRSHERLRASYSFVYNSRLNLAGIYRRLFPGFTLPAMTAYRNADVVLTTPDENRVMSVTPTADRHEYTVTVYIKQQGEDYAVTAGFSGQEGTGYPLGPLFSRTPTHRRSWPCFLYYPDPDAYRMVITDRVVSEEGEEEETPRRLMVDLKPHDFLNGAYALLDRSRVVSDNYDPSLLPAGPCADPDAVPALNKVYVSETDNPFHFPVEGRVSVGTGSVIALSTAAKALSQGQFGQFPLYAFTSEGVWALEISASGAIAARQPITRDVLLSPLSLAQTDSAVLFATSRGIMLLSGSQTQCISEVLDPLTGKSPDVPSGLPRLSEVVSRTFPDLASLLDAVPDTPFTEFIRGCRMAWCYSRRRVIVFNPSRPYAYVYSLRSSLWGVMESSLRESLRSYPSALALSALPADTSSSPDPSEDSCDVPLSIVDLESSEAVSVNVLLVTRPLKFGAPDILKTVTSLIQRGVFLSNCLVTLLYATRDWIHHHAVSSSNGPAIHTFRGTPYKAFTLVAMGCLRPSDTIDGASFRLLPRFTNRLR